MASQDQVIARGERTTTRIFTRADVDGMQAWQKHTDALYAVYNIKPLTAEERDQWYQERISRPHYRMFAIDNERGEMIGRVVLWKINPRAKSAFLGIEIAAGRMNQGYGSDVLLSFQDFFFGSMKFETLKLHVSAVNNRAKACYLKCGFKHTNLFWTPSAKQSELDVFGDDRYAHIRHFFKKIGDHLEVLFHEMTVLRKDWEARAELSGARGEK
jgi:diamine N-acetyltransferase